MDRVGGEDAAAVAAVDAEEEVGGEKEEQRRQDVKEQQNEDGLTASNNVATVPPATHLQQQTASAPADGKVVRKEKSFTSSSTSTTPAKDHPRPPPCLREISAADTASAPDDSNTNTNAERGQQQQRAKNSDSAEKMSDEILKIVEQRARVARLSLSLDNKAEEDGQTEHVEGEEEEDRSKKGDGGGGGDDNNNNNNKLLNYNKLEEEDRLARISPYLDEANEEEEEGCSSSSSSSKGDNNNIKSNPKLKLKEEQMIAGMASDSEEGYPVGGYGAEQPQPQPQPRPPRLLRATGTTAITTTGPGAFAQSTRPTGINVSISRSATIFNNPSTTDEERINNYPERQEIGGGGTTGSGLVEANLVTPIEELPIATQFHNTTTTTNDQREQQASEVKRRRTDCILLTTVVVVVITGIVLMAVLLSRDSSPTTDTTNQSTTTTLQQQPQDDEEQRILDLLPEISIPLIKGDNNETRDSPQYKAYEWIMGDPFLQTYSNHRIQTRYILATLFFATDGQNWINNRNWLSYQHHECQWYSRPSVHDNLKNFERAGSKFVVIEEVANITEIPCRTSTSASSGIIFGDDDGNNERTFQHLILAGNNIRGTLPEEFFYLSKLQTFNFNFNPNLVGTIDSTLATKGMAQNLKVMSFARNPKISGYLPTQIGLMTNLLEITLHHTNIQTTIPTELFLLSNNLRGIRIGQSARFSGTIPTQVGNMSLLRYIFFQTEVDDDNDNTGLNGVIPSQLGRLTGLESLSLYDNGSIHMMGEIPTQLGLMTNLWRPILRRFNRLASTVPTEIAQLTNLERLTLGSNFTGRIPTQLGHLTKLEQLNLADCRLSGLIPSELGLLTMCTAMRFHSSSGSGNGPNHQQQQQLTGTVPATLCSNGRYPVEQLENVLVPMGVKGLSFDCDGTNLTTTNKNGSHLLCGCDWCPCYLND